MEEQFQEPTYDQPRNPPEGLDLQALLLGDANRLRFIRRYNTALVLHSENVAEHSYYVAFYAMCLARYAERKGFIIDFRDLMEKALIHDIDESRTGDFTRTFKHSRPKLRELLEKAAYEEAMTIFSSLFPGDDYYVNLLGKRWASAKDASYEGCIIALADYLCVFSHMWHELSCSNVTMLDNYRTMVKYAATFSTERYNFLREVVEQIQWLTSQVLAGRYERGMGSSYFRNIGERKL